ncbi:MAG TPA: gluconokinase [Pyrinomonadaceae bacterium]
MSTVFDEAVLEERPEIDLSTLPSLRPEPDPVVVLALDIGTSGTRAALFDSRGDQIEGSFLHLPAGEYSELLSGNDVNADALVASVAQLLDAVVERAEEFVARIDYVAAASFWHSLIGVDDAGRAITPLLGWADTRAAAAVPELRELLPETETHTRTGCRFHPGYWPAKLLWLRKSSPDLFSRVRRWLSFADYLYLQLFGNSATSVSMASATGLLNQRTCEWDEETLSALDIDESFLPPIVAARRTAGGLRDEFMLRWPMLERATWFQAIGDGAANNIGAGCVSRERVALTVGTSGAMRMLSSRAAPTILPPELFCYRADRERVVIGGALSDGGGLLRWLQNSLKLTDDADLNDLLEVYEPDSHGLTILPFWSGERAPGWSSSATGTIHGLTAATKPLDLARAALESIAYRFALIADPLESFAPAASITIAGKVFLLYPFWAQMMADVLGQTVELSAFPEATIRGAALLALETIGTIDTLETIKSEPVRTFAPDMQRHKVYRRAIERQQNLYRRLIGH